MEPNYTHGVPIPNQMRLELGRLIVDRFMDAHLNHVEPGFAQEECTRWLKQLGFDRVEWSQPQDDFLWLYLWRAGAVEHSYRHSTDLSGIDEFFLTFTGHDDLVVGLFNFAGERIL